jgi:ubiquinone/menaquinone biosynthesis C-methylase UbiE
MNVDLLTILKALADETRLRALRAVSMSEMSVAELVWILGVPQSTVSRHLKPLRDAQLVEARRNGTSVLYRRGPAYQDASLSGLLDRRLSELPGATQDRASVHRMLEARKAESRAFFERMAGSYESLTEPGGGWAALAQAMAVGLSGMDVADLGAGEGALSVIAARFARRVYAVDQSPAMLGEISRRAGLLSLDTNISLVSGDLEALPLPDASVDVAFLSQALHHAATPSLAIMEAARILRPGGRLVILDLASHEHEWVREQFADHWLGFTDEQLSAWCEAAGLVVRCCERVPGSSKELPVTFFFAEKHSTPKRKNKS